MSARTVASRFVGVVALALVLMGAMVVLGLWQLGVYDDHQHDDAQARLQQPAVALHDLLGPDDAFPSEAVSRPVTLTGHYLTGEGFTVRDSAVLDVDAAVVTPLVLADGSAVLVVRGAGPAAPAPGGKVAVSGVLEPSDPVGSALDTSRVTDGIRTAALVQAFDQDLYAGYVVATSSGPADTLAPIPPPAPDPSRWAGLRNLVYAVQWWVFAGFVAFMAWRMLTEQPDGVPDDTAAPTATSVR